MTDHLFINVGYGSYFYGDYYGAGYLGRGYNPWCQPRLISRNYYDPLFGYYSWRYRNVGWGNSLNLNYNFVLGNVNARPPRTFYDARRLRDNNQIRNSIVNGNVFQTNHNVINQTNITNITNNNVNNTTIVNNINKTKINSNDIDLTTVQARNAMIAQDVRVAKRGGAAGSASATGDVTTKGGAAAVTTPNLLPVKLENVDKTKLQQYNKQGSQYQEFARRRATSEGSATASIPGVGNATGKAGVGAVDPTKIGGGKFGKGGNVPGSNPVGNVAAKPGLELPKIEGVSSTGGKSWQSFREPNEPWKPIW